MEELNSNMDHFEPDPLLKPGAFIDPNPTAPNGGASFPTFDHNTNGHPKPPPSSAVDPTPAPVDASQPPDQGVFSPRPAWLPPGWKLDERVRSSGASAGSRDKYYVCPVTNRRFRSKKEVLYFLETGSTKKRKGVDTDADSAPDSTPTPKRKKSAEKAKTSWKNFNFDDVPSKVKWMLTDIYEGTWRPLVNGADRVPESAKQEWTAAFTYLTLQNSFSIL